jgi:hypothetical protein
MDVQIAGAVWWHLLLAIIAGAVLVNGIPHFINGVSGREFPSPFSGGPGTLDSAVRNVWWGALNFLIGGLLLWAASPSFGAPILWILLALAGFGFALVTAYIFSHPPATPRGKR